MRCGSGSNIADTLKVVARVDIGFGIAETFGHPGPQLAYLSRVPDGSGDWVKLYAAGTLANSSWAEPEGLS